MKNKSVALFMLIWFTCQNVGVLADALTPVGRADVAVDHASHCDASPGSSNAERQSATESGIPQSCGLECQCCASCSSSLTNNSALAGAISYFATPDTPYTRATTTPTLVSLFRPPISA
ncbi:MAG: hypothetical protein O6703_08225 [Gammaproteobacteria bacterium]|nr:hypothetical protein [Gammaproteobacteria bacterium]